MPSRSERIRRRADDEMDVIGHQAIGPHCGPGLAHPLGQQIEIDVLIAVLEKDRLAPIAPRRHMVRAAGNHDARQTGHG